MRNGVMKIDDFCKVDISIYIYIYDDLSLLTGVVILIVHKSVKQQRFGNLK